MSPRRDPITSESEDSEYEYEVTETLLVCDLGSALSSLLVANVDSSDEKQRKNGQQDQETDNADNNNENNKNNNGKTFPQPTQSRSQNLKTSLSQKIKDFSIIGIEEGTPIIRLGPYFFKGNIDETIGSQLVMEMMTLEAKEEAEDATTADEDVGGAEERPNANASATEDEDQTEDDEEEGRKSTKMPSKKKAVEDSSADDEEADDGGRKENQFPGMDNRKGTLAPKYQYMGKTTKLVQLKRVEIAESKQIGRQRA